MMKQKFFLLSMIGLILGIAYSCSTTDDTPLPILGVPEISDSGDTLHHTIPEFRFIDQDSNLVTKESFKNKIYVADFFFTSCPSVCSTMTCQVTRCYEDFVDETELMLIMHSLDTRNV